MPKYRQKYGQFTVEGRKGVDELIHSRYDIQHILVTKAYITKNEIPPMAEIIDEKEMQKLSSFSTAPGVLAVANTLEFKPTDLNSQAAITLCLDGISDPGNLGTIIRTADWFGIHQIVLSEDCTDFYNPKALSSTMGSFTRCSFIYADLVGFLKGKLAVGCFLNGVSLSDYVPQAPICLVVGSESHGIREDVAAVINQKITIPGYGKAESLNAAIAAGIVMEKFARILSK